MSAGGFRIGAVLLDFDGTLTEPGALSFATIREAIDCPPGQPILEFLAALPDAADRERRMRVLESFELAAAEASRPNRGAEAAVLALRERGLPVAVISRNGHLSIERALANFPGLSADDFDLILAREAQPRPKPAPDGVLLAARRLGVDPARLLVVGDYLFDLQAGRTAGSLTVLLKNGEESDHGWDHDFAIDSLAELPALVDLGLPLPPGKLPNALLGQFLATLPPDPHLLRGPGVGVDVAAVALGAPTTIVLKTDPITLAGNDAADYALCVNGNDLATVGATPRWFLASVLLPVGTTPSEAVALLGSLRDAADRTGVALCGGHTEVTDAVTRVLIAGTLVGVAPRPDLLDRARVSAGDRLLLTKGAGIEGTALLAREAEPALVAAGVPPSALAEALALRQQISIVAEARAAAADPEVTALHDVTEGGVAAAVAELSEAIGLGVAVDIQRIPVLDATRTVASALGLHPLGIIGSGALLICVRAAGAGPLLAALRTMGLRAEDIGSVLDTAPGVTASWGEEPAVWPRFATDEAARYLVGRTPVT